MARSRNTHFTPSLIQRGNALYMASLLLAVLGVYFWQSGGDAMLTHWLEAHDIQWLNTIWRIIGEIGLGRWQWLFCLVGVAVLIHGRHLSVLPQFPQTMLRIFVGTFYIWLRGLAFQFKPVQRSQYYWQQQARYVQQLPLKTRALAYAIPIMFWAGVLCSILKALIGRPRPKMLLWHDISTSTGPSLDAVYHSFPSGHTTTTFALLAVLVAVFPRYAKVFISIAILTGAARVLAVTPHFLGDVLIGAGLGLAVGVYFVRRFKLVLKS